MVAATSLVTRVAELPARSPLVWMPTAVRSVPMNIHTGAPLWPPAVSTSYLKVLDATDLMLFEWNHWVPTGLSPG